MGFISFSLKYFKDNIIKLENEHPNRRNIYKAKQLLKIVDDLVYEGYTSLFKTIEENFFGIERLHNYLAKNNEKPFAVRLTKFDKKTFLYKNEKLELGRCLSYYLKFALNTSEEIESINPFIDEIRAFSNWIGYKDDTAYIFLLRDTLLPYLYFKNKKYKNLYPYLISRKMMEDFTKEKNIDDEFRNILVEALEYGKVKNYNEFCEYCFPKIRESLSKYSAFLDTTKLLLKNIKENKIVVVESGVFGTIPMILASLDPRVTIKMFTAILYFQKIYDNKIYTKAYERNSYFETLYSQEVFLQYKGFKNMKFYVQRCSNKDVENLAIEEINQILK